MSSAGAREDAGSREPAERWAELAARLATRPGATGRVAGRYDITRPIGGGGMGVVYLAQDRELRRSVALKVLHAHRAADPASARRRVRHEARALARLHHKNVLHVYDVCEHRGQTVLVLEHVDGSDLRHHLAEHPALSAREIVDLFVQAAAGLAAAHEAGVVHGDVKPDNMLVGRDGRVRVADFGLAAAWLGTRMRAPAPDWAPGAGTPRYMAPEQLRGEPASPASDQFAWCVALHEALDGRPPYPGETTTELLDAITRGELRPVRRRIEPSLRRVLARGMCPDPRGRWSDLRALLDALGSRPRRRQIAALSGVVLGLAALWWVGASPSPCQERHPAPPWRTRDRAVVRDAVDRRVSATDPARWARVEGDLDRFATRWSEVVTEVCDRVASATPEAQRVALACPTRLGREVDARVDVVLEADDRALPSALGAIATLPDPWDCLADSPSEPAELLAELDPEADTRASARVDALVAAGRYASALPIAQELASMADTRGDVRTSSAAALRLGSIFEALGRGSEARLAFERAALMAEEAGAAEIAARAAFQLVFLLASRDEDVKAAEPWFRHGEAATRRAGSPLPLRAELAAAEADLAAARGDLDAARTARARVVDLRIEELGSSHPTVATARHNLAIVSFRLGDYEEARDLYLQVLDVRIAELGPDHPLVGTTHGNLGPVYQRLGDLALAQLHDRRALEIAEASFGTGHYQTAAALANLAVALAEGGDPKGAADLERRALRILEARFGADSPNVARVLANLGNREAGLGHPDVAETYLRRALDIHERAGTAPSPERAAIVGGLGLVHIEQGRAAEAAAELSWAGDVFEATVGRSDGYTLTARAGQIDALRLAGDPDAAVKVAEAALAGVEGPPGPIATLQVAYAWALLDRGDPTTARVLLRRARDLDPEAENLEAVEALVRAAERP